MLNIYFKNVEYFKYFIYLCSPKPQIINFEVELDTKKS